MVDLQKWLIQASGLKELTNSHEQKQTKNSYSELLTSWESMAEGVCKYLYIWEDVGDN
jgi:hypothetical protein